MADTDTDNEVTVRQSARRPSTGTVLERRNAFEALQRSPSLPGVVRNSPPRPRLSPTLRRSPSESSDVGVTPASILARYAVASPGGPDDRSESLRKPGANGASESGVDATRPGRPIRSDRRASIVGDGIEVESLGIHRSATPEPTDHSPVKVSPDSITPRAVLDETTPVSRPQQVASPPMSSASQASAALTAALASPPNVPAKVSPRPSLTSLQSQRSNRSDGPPPVPPRRNALHRTPSLSLSTSSSTGESPRGDGTRSMSSRTTTTATTRSSYASSHDSGKLSLDFGPDFGDGTGTDGTAKGRYAGNDRVEVLSHGLERPPPSPGAQFGLGITSDAAVLAAPMPTQTLSAPVMSNGSSASSFPFGAASPQLSHSLLNSNGASPLFPASPFADARPSPPTRSRSSSVAAERARWSTLIGPRFTTARTQVVQPSSERTGATTPTPEDRDGTVRWAGETDLADIDVPTGTAHLLLGGTRNAPGLITLLTRAIPLLQTTLITLDLSHSSLVAIPPLSALESLAHLDLSGNTFASMAATDVSLPPTLRVLKADDCALAVLPTTWAELPQLRVLSVRDNALRSLPGWLARLTELDRLELDGNPFQGVWAELVQPLLTQTAVAPTRPSSVMETPSPVDPHMRNISVSSSSSVKFPDFALARRPNHDAIQARSVSEGRIKRMRSMGDLQGGSGGTRSRRANTTAQAPSVTDLRSQFAVQSLSSKSSAASFATSDAGSDTAVPSKKSSFFKRSISRFKSSSPMPGYIPPRLSPPSKTSSPPVDAVETVRRHRTVSVSTGRDGSPSLATAIEDQLLEQSGMTPPQLEELGFDDDAASSPEVVAFVPTADALRTLMAYLRDLDDLSADPLASRRLSRKTSSARLRSSPSAQRLANSSTGTTSTGLSSLRSRPSSSGGADTDSPDSTRSSSMSGGTSHSSLLASIKLRDDPAKRVRAVQEFIATERSYVAGLRALVEIYVQPAALAAGSGGETVVPAAERRAVFNNVEHILAFHDTVFLLDMERAVAFGGGEDEDAAATATARAREIGRVFIRNAAFLKLYSFYITSFDAALAHFRAWTIAPETSPTQSATSSPVLPVGVAPISHDTGVASTLSSGQRKRIKAYLKQCRAHPNHKQLNCESYLLLPVQRIPRYKMLFESLVSCTPLENTDPLLPDPTIVNALDQAAALAADLNERKRESESRSKLIAWQSRIGATRFRSPLVQPHRTLIKEGALQLCRVVKRQSHYVEAPGLTHSPSSNSTAPSLVQIHSLLTDSRVQPIIALLCSDILVLTHDSGLPSGPLDLFTVLRLSASSSSSSSARTLPASVFGSDGMIRLIDSRAVLYLRCGSSADAEAWAAAINTQLSSIL